MIFKSTELYASEFGLPECWPETNVFFLFDIEYSLLYFTAYKVWYLVIKYYSNRLYYILGATNFELIIMKMLTKKKKKSFYITYLRAK